MLYNAQYQVVDAIQFTGDNSEDVIAFINVHGSRNEPVMIGEKKSETRDLREIRWDIDNTTSAILKVNETLMYVGGATKYVLINSFVFDKIYNKEIVGDSKFRYPVQCAKMNSKGISAIYIDHATDLSVIRGFFDHTAAMDVECYNEYGCFVVDYKIPDTTSTFFTPKQIRISFADNYGVYIVSTDHNIYVMSIDQFHKQYKTFYSKEEK